MERRIFEELQELKNCQIKCSRVNEPLYVKRMVDSFKRDAIPGFTDYREAYTFKAYEKFLYGQYNF